MNNIALIAGSYGGLGTCFVEIHAKTWGDLNKGIKMSREKDLEQAQEIINKYVAEGWKLHQTVSQNDMVGALVGVFCKEK
ncbi:MAG: DUF4177 domain-containing protein [Eubacteriales bacterium]|nr:DUF4177 domain-containing protein [Eubacteriales bacterium]